MVAETIRIAFCALGAALAVASCSKSEPAPTGPSSGADQAGRTASGGSSSGSGATASAGTLNIGGSLNEPDPGAPGGAPAIDRGDACVTSTDTVAALPSVLELVVDTSGSMDWPPGWAPQSPDDSKPPGATKWEITRDALRSAAAALPADMALGVNFYPNVQQEGDTCLLDAVALPIRLLGDPDSEARADFEAALDEVVPVGATPTHGAYRFGLEQLTSSALPGNRFLLLITDGTPTCTIDCECTEDNEPVDPQPLLDEAELALSDGVRTFVIGSPGSEETRQVLSQLASVGGTAKDDCADAGPNYCHFDMTTQPDLADALAGALDEITKSLRSCEYPVPEPPQGQTLDPDRVNVLYTPGAGTTRTVGRDPSADECNEGWQYSADGEHIVLCGELCQQVQSDPDDKVEVLFGCETVIADPR